MVSNGKLWHNTKNALGGNKKYFNWLKFRDNT